MTSLKKHIETLENTVVAQYHSASSLGDLKELDMQLRALLQLYVLSRGDTTTSPTKTMKDFLTLARVVQRTIAEQNKLNVLKQTHQLVGIGGMLPRVALPDTGADIIDAKKVGVGDGDDVKSDSIEGMMQNYRNNIRDEQYVCGKLSWAHGGWKMIGGLEKEFDTLEKRFGKFIPYPKSTLDSKQLSAVLLYGPPGTGKTQLARAIAFTTNGAFLEVSASTVQSKYVGQSGKQIRALFRTAREWVAANNAQGNRRPFVIFFDEFDGLFGREGEAGSAQVTTELLREMEGFESNNERVLFLGSTNRAYNIPENILSRFQTRIVVDYVQNELSAVREELSKLKRVIDNLLIANELPHFSTVDVSHSETQAAIRTQLKPLFGGEDSNIDTIFSGNTLTLSMVLALIVFGMIHRERKEFVSSRRIKQFLTLELWTELMAVSVNTLQQHHTKTRWLYERSVAYNMRYDSTQNACVWLVEKASRKRIYPMRDAVSMREFSEEEEGVAVRAQKILYLKNNWTRIVAQNTEDTALKRACQPYYTVEFMQQEPPYEDTVQKMMNDVNVQAALRDMFTLVDVVFEVSSRNYSVKGDGVNETLSESALRDRVSGAFLTIPFILTQLQALPEKSLAVKVKDYKRMTKLVD